MKTIAFINQKGGVGKTTATLNIGAGLAQLGMSVLLIDLDPQANLTASCGIESDTLETTIYNVLQQEKTLSAIVIKQEKLSIAPASIELAAFERAAATVVEREYLLKRAIAHEKYDYVLIDCPPSLGLLTINALAAADEVYIPVQTEFLALHGLSQLLDTCKVIWQRINPSLKLGGIIGMRYNRRRINKEVIEHLRESFKEKVFNTAIRENVSLSEAPSFGLDIYRYKPDSIGAQDYTNLCKEIIQRSIGL